MSYSIAVLGGGASGMIAAIAAARRGMNVAVYEKNMRLGKKLLCTGNGRCNILNLHASKESYHGSGINILDSVMNEFWVKDTIEFFEELGLVFRYEDGGKAYPYSNQAGAVLDVLRFELERLCVPIIYGFEAERLQKTKNGYTIKAFDGRSAFANRVIIAAGGRAAPDTGSNGSGYGLCKPLGHKITELSPSLVQIKTEQEFVKSLKGIKTDAVVRLGEKTYGGELLFTDYGLSGPPIFSVSSALSCNTEQYIYIDLMPEYSIDDVLLLLRRRRSLSVTLEDYFVGMLNKRLGMAILKRCKILPFSRLCGSLTDEELNLLAQSIKNLGLRLDGTLSWNSAQVTAGGIDSDGINPKTLGSLYCEGVYFCGEIIDIDGDCGGFNLQWAWSSGYIAGNSAAD